MRRLLIALLVLALVFLTPVALLRSERVVLALAHWAVDSFTDLRLELKNPRLLPVRGLLSADEIHLYPKADDGPPFVSIVDFTARVDADDIYFGNLVDSDLQAQQVIIYVSDRDSTADPEPIQWLRYLGWLPRNLRVAQMHLVSASERTFIFPLKDLRGARFDGTGYQVTAMAHYEGEPQDMRLTLSLLQDEATFARLNIDGEFVAPDTGSTIRLAGEVRGSVDDFNYDLQLDAHYTDISEFLQGFEVGARLRGRLQVAANMSGDADGYVLQDAHLVLDNMPDYGVEAAGSLRYGADGDSEIALVAAGEIASLGYAVDWVEADMDAFGRAQASATLSGSLQRPVVDQFILRTESSDGLTVNVKGRLAPADERTEADNRVQVDVQGPDLDALEGLLGELPELPQLPGGWRASGLMLGKPGAIALQNLVLEVGSRQQLALRITGSAGNVAGTQQEGLAALEDLELTVNAYSPDTALAGQLLQLELPPWFELEASAAFTGSGERLTLTDGSARLTSSDIELQFTPTQATLLAGADPYLQELRGHVNLRLSDTSALSQYIEAPIPALGPVTASAGILQRGDKFSLQGLEANVSGELLTIDATGSIADLKDLSGIVVESRLSHVDTRSLLVGAIEDFHYQADLGSLRGRFTLANPGGAWRVSNIDIQSTEPGGRLDLALRGELNELASDAQANLAISLRARDTALLEALSGLPLNPVAANVRITTTPGLLTLASEARVGDTMLNAEADIVHQERELRSLRLALQSPLLSLADFGLQADARGDREYRPVEKIDDIEPGERLEAILAHSPRYPTDITVNFNGISGEHTNIQRLDMHMTGLDNRYTLRRFSLAYADAEAEVRGIIDLNPRPPAISIAGEALTIPLSTLGKDLGLKSEITGDLSLRGGITATGRDVEELTASLDGSLALALEDAVIAGGAYDVLATDLLAWIYSGAALEDSTNIDCTMGQFLLRNGVATSDSLYIETRKMVAKGKAKIDLVKQKMDVEITPRSKSRSLQVPSSVRLRGDFDDPRAIISPVSAAADAYTSFITLVPRMALKLFGIEKSSKRRHRPCAA